MIEAIAALPEVSFIDNKTLDDVQAEMIADYEAKYKEVTGKSLTLRRADPEAIKLYVLSVQVYHMLMHIDKSGKMDLLKYAYSAFLDNLGALRGVTRLTPTPAKTTVRFTLSAAQASAITIPAGTRVSNGDITYFAVDETAQIPAGSTYVDVACTCTEAGSKNNGIMAGALNTLVDHIAYVATVSNIEATAGGSDTESDEDMEERIYLAPGSYSTAGARDAYIYHTKSYSSSIGDVEVTSPDACEVMIKFLMDDGSLPTTSFCNAVKAYLSEDTLRPLTDSLTVEAPSTSTFNINLNYYINESDKDKETIIKDKVNAAIDEYIVWQTNKIGRDINPSVLTQKIIDAGAKRVVITSPVFTTVSDGYVAALGTETVTYAGREAD